MALTMTLSPARLVLLVMGTIVLLGMGYAVSQSVGTVWHPLNKIAITGTTTSVDPDNDGIIDETEHAVVADVAATVPCTGVADPAGNPCANRLAVATRTATSFPPGDPSACQQACDLSFERCVLMCNEVFPAGSQSLQSCQQGCEVKLGLCLGRCGSGTTYQSCDAECAAFGETCTRAWETDGTTVGCEDNANARQCTCLSSQ